MLLKQSLQNKQPVFGGRSAACFGLNLWLDVRHFWRTSNYKTGPKTPDPRIKSFEVKAQGELNSRLIEAGLRFGFTNAEIQAEWLVLTQEATKVATAAYRLGNGLQIETPVGVSAKERKAMEVACMAGFEHLMGRVGVRSRSAEAWSMSPPMLLGLNDAGYRQVYILRQRIHAQDVDGKRRYKIGDSFDAERRLKTHRTSNPDFELVAIIDGSDVITETNVQLLFPGCRCHQRDWFALTDEQASIFLDRIKLVAEIRRRVL